MNEIAPIDFNGQELPKMKKVWKHRPGSGFSWLITDDPAAILYDLVEMSVEDEYEIQCVEMSQEELDNLLEHDGW